MKPGLGARLCPRCGTRVDERRGKFSLHCLSCGQPLASDRLSVASPYARAPKGSSPLLWIVAVLCFLGVLGAVGVTILLVNVSREPDEDDGIVAASPAGTPAVLPSRRVPASAAAPSVPPTRLRPSPPVTRPVTSSTGAPSGVVTPRPAGSAASIPPLGPFDRDLAEARVDRVMTTLSACRRDGNPTGSSTVGITFENDGRVGTRMLRRLRGDADRGLHLAAFPRPGERGAALRGERGHDHAQPHDRPLIRRWPRRSAARQGCCDPPRTR